MPTPTATAYSYGNAAHKDDIVVRVQFPGKSKIYDYLYTPPTAKTLGLGLECLVLVGNKLQTVAIYGLRGLTTREREKGVRMKYIASPFKLPPGQEALLELRLRAMRAERRAMESCQWPASAFSASVFSHVRDATSTNHNLINEKDTTMELKIETLTMINGNDLRELSDEVVLGMIRKAQQQLKDYEELGVDLPRRLRKSKERLEQNLQRFIEALDKADADDEETSS